MTIFQRQIQCGTVECPNYKKIWIVHAEPYMIPLQGHYHGPTASYSIVERNGAYYGESHIEPMINTELHMWPILYCDGCGNMPSRIFETGVRKEKK